MGLMVKVDAMLNLEPVLWVKNFPKLPASSIEISLHLQHDPVNVKNEYSCEYQTCSPRIRY